MAFHPIPIHYHGGLLRLPMASIRCITSIFFSHCSLGSVFSWPYRRQRAMACASYATARSAELACIGWTKTTLHPTFAKMNRTSRNGWKRMTCYDHVMTFSNSWSMMYAMYAAGARDLQQWGLCHSRHAPETAAELVPHLQLFPPFAPRHHAMTEERERESKYLNVRKPACATCFEQIWNDMRQNMAEFT